MSCHTLRIGDDRIHDAAWFYPKPLENALEASRDICASPIGIRIDVNGEQVE